MDAEYTSRNGEHWRDYGLQLRQVGRLPVPVRFIYRAAHLLMLPLMIPTLVALRNLLPVISRILVKKVGSARSRSTLGASSDLSSPTEEIKPEVSIVVPFFNREDSVAACVESLLMQHLPSGARFEIIAVDNNSTDRTADELKRYPVRLVHCATRGPAAARNAGWKVARAPIVAFTDSDCIAQPGWLADLVAPFAREDVLWSSGCIDAQNIDNGATYAAMVFRLLDNQVFFRGSGFFPPFCATANAAYRKSALEKCGGFDENLYMSEDADLAWRVLELGGTAVYRSDAVIRHAHRETLMGLFQQAVGYGVAAVAVFAKHRTRFNVCCAFDWERWRSLVWLPWDIVWCLMTKRGFSRVGPLYFLTWNTGITIGCIRGTLRHRVLYL